MATTRELRRRIRSVRSTRQITRAMELVASSKLRGAIKDANHSQEYADGLARICATLIAQDQQFSHPLLQFGRGEQTLVIAFSSDQGLAGVFHSNNLKTCLAFPPSTEFYVVGKRLANSLKRMHRTVLPQSYSFSRTLDAPEIEKASNDLVTLFGSNTYHSIYLVSTHYQSALIQKVSSTQLVPFTPSVSQPLPLLVEPDLSTVLPIVLTQTFTALLLAAARQTRASEFAIRRTSMHAATENAGDLIERYTLAYNRARQAAITTEIAEIVGGAAALTS